MYTENKNTEHKAFLSDKPNLNPVPYVFSMIIMLCLLSFILSCKLAVGAVYPEISSGSSLAQTMLGDTRSTLSAKFFEQADVYFHRGVPHKKERAFTSDPFQLIRDKVSPEKHLHLEGSSGIKEIMPWLDLSIKSNPQNMDSYLVAAYWMANGAKRPDLALGILNKAQQNLPYSYRPQLEKGRLFLKSGNHKAAFNAFSACLAFWQKTANPDDRGDLLEKSRALLYRGLLYEESGQVDKAISDMEAMLDIIPAADEIRKRVHNLKNGLPVNPSAHMLLTELTHKYDKQMHHCNHEHEHHHDDADHEHCDHEH
jgi:tetratricopeptide (TPR) repeat protein